MGKTLVETLADFASGVSLDELPPQVIEESKRVILDSIGCAVAGVDTPKGSAGIKSGLLIGGSSGPASMFGTPHRTSVFGAAFANGETINALDFDAIVSPGHVAPYVLPGALAIAEQDNLSGRRLIEAVAVAHEMSYRISNAMSNHRTAPQDDGDIPMPDVLGFTSTVFGAAVANGMLLGQSSETIENAIGISALISPVNSHRAWIEHAGPSSIKYTMAGPVVQAGLIAAYSAQFGHTGDPLVLDDLEHGYPRYIGTARWASEIVTDGLGSIWNFPASHIFKPYPHCRVTHGPIEAVLEIVSSNHLAVEEIDAIRCWSETWIARPLWLTTDVPHPHQAQMSVAYALAVAAHQIPPGVQWQSPETLDLATVKALMERVSVLPHPDYVRLVAQDPLSRPTRIEIDARGTTYAAERTYPVGTPREDAYLSTDALVVKFRANAAGALSGDDVDRVADGLLDLEHAPGVRELLGATRARVA